MKPPPTKPEKLTAAARRLQRRAGGPIEVAIVLGSGLADAAFARIEGRDVSYEKLRLPHLTLAGHPMLARAGTWRGRRVVAFAGRAHLYQGFSPREVTTAVRLAAAAGATTIVLTNAAGGLSGAFARGDLMLISDQLNLTGASPLDGTTRDPFLNATGLYDPELLSLARAHAGDRSLREGVYAGLRGPQYESPAECEALRRLGADAVGMSTVLETLAARSLGLSVLGISLITNVIGAVNDATHADVLAVSREGGEAMASVLDAVIAKT